MQKSTKSKLGIWCPTYKRANKLAAVVENLRIATKNPYTLYFGVEPDDKNSIDFIRELAKSLGDNNPPKLVINQYTMGYSNTIQTIYENSNEPFGVHVNDDFLFLPNWDEVPIAMFETPTVSVVGVKQNQADQSFSAVFFVRRKYIEEQSGVIGMPGRVFYPYGHNYQDTEFTQTAQYRGVWAKCDTPCIDHQHPGFTGAEKDETYKKNDALASVDESIFNSRKHLWK